MRAPLSLRFVRGTLELRGPAREDEPPTEDYVWDERTACLRAPASAYANTLRALHRGEREYEDEARAYEVLDAPLRVHRDPRPYQAEAVEAWLRARSAGVVVLPTGAGKTSRSASSRCSERKARDTLVVTPTLRPHAPVVRSSGCKSAFGEDGRARRRRLTTRPLPITVTTYDSAHIHVERLGNALRSARIR